ncbi:efflux RND transporter periplasmic adaptor subunit [Sphingomicrobium sediminis]|uniref:Efflux RND transporter periplasmic adaptor subunit n=1 Tax=Sphingomicrobium sediminis TaxID=2950949 RepID=A0A9X2END0_9SPHN|nr:efflux RND transporter periplasmic adaptor subunit [Sphingomicrobium sediminis]MCM8558377.1 efflux RND transporter periplasmic adaptor subunit [Sphingomicrobium sediminis]
MAKLSLSRQILPIVALIGVAIAIYMIFIQSPDRSMAEAEETPARVNGELAGEARVAGAGIVEPSSETIEIGTAISGIVETVLVRPGERVTAGEPLFRVDTRSLRSRISETEAAIRRARAAIAEARAAEATATRQLDLYRNIDDPLAVSRSEIIAAEGNVSNARARRQLAEAELASAQASLSTARTELDRATVRAPISGEILRVDVRPGELVNSGPGGGGPYIRMGETQPLHVRIDVDEDEAVRVALGEPAIVSPRGDADARVEASFVRAEPLVVPKTSLTNSASERVDVRVLQLIYALPADAPEAFRVGQQVDAFIPAKQAAEAE